jgi:two-component system, NtrC family, sensor kinase
MRSICKVTVMSPGQSQTTESTTPFSNQTQDVSLGLILDSIPQYIFWKDLNSVYLGCNQRWAEFVGFGDPKEIVGKTDEDLPWLPGEAAVHRERDRQLIGTCQPQRRVLMSLWKATGERIWFEASNVPLFYHDQVIGILYTFERTTELEQQAETLKKSAELLQLVLDNIPQAIFWKDRSSTYLGCNKNWAQAAGIQNLADVVGKTDFELLWTPEESALYYEQDQAVMNTDTPVLHLLEHRLEANEKEAWINVNKIPIHDVEGKVIGVLGTIEDISDRKQAEIALQQSEAQLRQQAQQLKQTLQQLRSTQAQLIQTEKMSSLGQLVAGIAHEINNPINFIHGNITPANEYAEGLLRLIRLYQQHYPNPHPDIADESEAIDLAFLMLDLPKLLKSMTVGTERIKQIVLSLRNFSRIDEADMKVVNIHDGIESTLLILQHRLKDTPDKRRIEIVKKYGDLPQVQCYAGQLNQVFMNIIANAIEALEERDQHHPKELCQHSKLITIRTECLSESRIVIRIQDNGSGISTSVQQQLFDPFFTTKPVGQGTGLGLSISYQIVVDKHQGVLKCFSEPGQGSEFWIEIPTRQKQL